LSKAASGEALHALAPKAGAATTALDAVFDAGTATLIEATLGRAASGDVPLTLVAKAAAATTASDVTFDAGTATLTAVARKLVAQLNDNEVMAMLVRRALAEEALTEAAYEFVSEQKDNEAMQAFTRRGRAEEGLVVDAAGGGQAQEAQTVAVTLGEAASGDAPQTLAAKAAAATTASDATFDAGTATLTDAARKFVAELEDNEVLAKLVRRVLAETGLTGAAQGGDAIEVSPLRIWWAGFGLAGCGVYGNANGLDVGGCTSHMDELCPLAAADAACCDAA
jgi:hypothetical protein